MNSFTRKYAGRLILGATLLLGITLKTTTHAFDSLPATVVSGTGYSLIYDGAGNYIAGFGSANPPIRGQGATGHVIPEGAFFYRNDLGYPNKNSGGSWVPGSIAGGFADGTAAAPSIFFSSQPGLGFYRQSSNLISTGTNGTMATSGLSIGITGSTFPIALTTTTLGMGTAVALKFSPDTEGITAPDLTAKRSSAGIFLISGGTSGSTPGALGLSAQTFASLGTPVNGTFYYCSDCTIAATCAGAGNGAFAKRLNAVWVCN